MNTTKIITSHISRLFLALAIILPTTLFSSLYAPDVARAATITFIIDFSDNGQATITKTVGGVTMTISNGTCGGVSRHFKTDDDGIFFTQPSGPSCVTFGVDAFDISFDSDVTLQSYEVGYVEGSTSGTFDLTATSGNSLNNPLNPVGPYSFNGTPSLTVGETASVTVSMTGTGPNQIRTITVVNTPEPEIDLQGQGQSIPNGSTTPSTANDTDFGSVTVGTTPVTHTFTISNSGTADLTLPSGVTLATGTHFSVTASPSSPVISNSTTTFQVTFDPSSAGSFTDTVSIANNDSDETPYTFVISGTGMAVVTAPEIDIQGNGQSIPNGSTTPSTADDTDFGSVTVGGTPVTHTFTISNSGTADLTLPSGVTLATGTHFSVTASPSSPVISNSTTTFDITFDPASVGPFTDTVSIANNDADENPYTFVIGGSTFDLAVNKTAIDSTTDDTTTITYTVSVQNIGGVDATGVVISDTLPVSVTFVSASGGNSYTPASGVWDVGNVAANTGVTMTLVVTGTDIKGKPIVNTAVLTDSTPADTNTNNNSNSVTMDPIKYYFSIFFKNTAP